LRSSGAEYLTSLEVRKTILACILLLKQTTFSAFLLSRKTATVCFTDLDKLNLLMVVLFKLQPIFATSQAA
jgi:hypothetical protein